MEWRYRNGGEKTFFLLGVALREIVMLQNTEKKEMNGVWRGYDGLAGAYPCGRGFAWGFFVELCQGGSRDAAVCCACGEVSAVEFLV